MIKWPLRSIPAIAKFFETLQDIDIYVEDTAEGDHVFYGALFTRIAPQNVKIVKVIPAGDRNRVLKLCSQHDFSARRALFLVDGDLYWVRGLFESLPDGAHRLPAYCMENLLICENAVVDILFECCGSRTREAIKSTLDWPSFVNQDLQVLIELFEMYAVSHSLSPSLPTVSLGIGPYLTAARKGVHSVLDHGKVRAKISQIMNDLTAVFGQAVVLRELQGVKSRFALLQTPSYVVSGKDLIFPLLMMRCASVVPQKIQRKSLKLRLAARCDTQSMSTISQAILDAASGRVPAKLV